VIETGDSSPIYSVAFHPDGTHLFTGNADGVRRWRVADGQEVGKGMQGMNLNAISVSRDHKWIVCGTTKGASVWDAKTQEKAIELEGTTFVGTLDISPDSTSFATGTNGNPSGNTSIWNILTGERLVGPLQHDGSVSGVQFSPNGELIATLCRVGNFSIRVFDSHNGDQLVEINNEISRVLTAVTPLAWSSSGQQIFVISNNNQIKSFDASTGSQLAESHVHDDEDPDCIALASNGKFLTTFANRSITFWETSTLTQIGSAIEDGQRIWSIALSPDCGYLATGGYDGNIIIRNLSDILPDSYGPFVVRIYVFTSRTDSWIPAQGKTDNNVSST